MSVRGVHQNHAAAEYDPVGQDPHERAARGHCQRDHGRKIEHQAIPLSALIDGMVQHGLPRLLAELYASFDAGTAAGELDVTSDAVQRFTGQKAQAMRDFLVANKAAWAV